MLVAMATLKIEVNLMTCMFASVLVGLTGDNAIQFLMGSHMKNGRADLASGIDGRGGASVICSLLMATAALFFLLSYFGPPRAFGLLLSSGLLAALFGDLWILRSLLK